MKKLRVFNADHAENHLPKSESIEGGEAEEKSRFTIGKWDPKKKEWVTD